MAAPSLLGEAKDLLSVKKVLTGEEDWMCVKEFLGWIIDMEEGTVALPERKIQEQRELISIMTTQRRMGRKEIERLVGKLRFMHLATNGAVANIYHLQQALSQGGVDRAWLSPEFHCNITDWQTLVDQTAPQPTHLEKIVRREPTHLGFCDASGLGSGGVWIDPSLLGQYLVWRHPWPEDIIAKLESSTNREGTITNSNLVLAVIILHKATLLSSVPEA